MGCDWEAITSGPIGCKARGMTAYHYIGDVNPMEYGGAWINSDTFHVVRLEGFDCGLEDDKGRPICHIESLQLVCWGKKEIRESLACVGQDVSKWLAMPKAHRRLTLCEALLSYGHYDPANEFPDWHTIETRRESAAFRAVNTFIR